MTEQRRHYSLRNRGEESKWLVGRLSPPAPPSPPPPHYHRHHTAGNKTQAAAARDAAEHDTGASIKTEGTNRTWTMTSWLLSLSNLMSTSRWLKRVASLGGGSPLDVAESPLPAHVRHRSAHRPAIVRPKVSQQVSQSVSQVSRSVSQSDTHKLCRLQERLFCHFAVNDSAIPTAVTIAR